MSTMFPPKHWLTFTILSFPSRERGRYQSKVAGQINTVGQTFANAGFLIKYIFFGGGGEEEGECLLLSAAFH